MTYVCERRSRAYILHACVRERRGRAFTLVRERLAFLRVCGSTVEHDVYYTVLYAFEGQYKVLYAFEGPYTVYTVVRFIRSAF